MRARCAGAVVVLTALAFAAPAQAAPGDISTVAGTGTMGFSGEGGSALAAMLNSPTYVAPTPDGGFLIADTGNNRIRKVLNGTITTVAGSGTAGFSGDGGAATAAKLSFATSVAPTPDGGFLIADQSNQRIRKVLNGQITTVAGTGTPGFSGDGGAATSAQISGPAAVATTPDGGFLFADQNNNRIRKVLNGQITTVAGNGTGGFSGDGGPATAAQLNYPYDVASTPDGGFLIADHNNQRIRKVLDGQITTVAGTGTSGFSGDGAAATSARISFPTSIASTPDGGFLIADQNNHRVRRVLDGTITTMAGSGAAGFSGDGGPATSAGLSTFFSVATTPDGGFLIADRYNNRIRRVEGVQTPTVVSTDPASPADQNTVKVFGNAQAGTVVNLYGAAGCTGPVLATGTGGQYNSAGLSVTVADNSTTTFFARASASAYTSACSTTSATYVESTPGARDTTAPNTKLGKAAIKTSARKATFKFSATEKGSTFACRLDRQKKFSKCRSPKTYKHLKPGKHTFRVRATDAAGNTDKTPAKRVFRIEARR